MKKFVLILLTICLFMPISNVSAETLNQYVAKAEAALKAERSKIAQKEMTEKEKKDALAAKEQTTKDIAAAEEEVARLEVEIKKLQDSIKVKDKEIKNLMRFVQVSNGESVYLEYAFGASSFTDFIYRVSVAEQLSNYNEQLIDEYNKTIKESEQKQKELAAKQEELKKKQVELDALVKKLATQIDGLSDQIQTYKSEYNALMSYVNSLRSMGCGGNEDINACLNKHSAPDVSTGGAFSGFLMPLQKGRITQNYYNTKTRQHNAIDMSNYEGAPIYPPVAGTVINIWRNSCGHIIAFIKHRVDGQTYTTVYYHLKTISVSVGQTVTAQTQIGTQGGNPSYDSCTTGSHLDFKLFKGEYGKTFFSLTSGPHMNPRVWLTQAPGEGGRFSSRS